MPQWRETFFSCPQPQENAPLILDLAGITHPDPAYSISRPRCSDGRLPYGTMSAVRFSPVPHIRADSFRGRSRNTDK